MVSFTTVGYRDLYPTTPAGRVAAGLMMFMGLIALGTVSGVFASSFSDDRGADADAPLVPAGASTSDDVLAEVRLPREELAELRTQLAAGGAGEEENPPPPGPGARQSPTEGE